MLLKYFNYYLFVILLPPFSQVLPHTLDSASLVLINSYFGMLVQLYSSVSALLTFWDRSFFVVGTCLCIF